MDHWSCVTTIAFPSWKQKVKNKWRSVRCFKVIHQMCLKRYAAWLNQNWLFNNEPIHDVKVWQASKSVWFFSFVLQSVMQENKLGLLAIITWSFKFVIMAQISCSQSCTFSQFLSHNLQKLPNNHDVKLWQITYYMGGLKDKTWS